ncbi:hypothetical protein [Streptomyces sp. 7N604]
MERLADIAGIASVRSTGYEATGHLLTLLADLAVPDGEGNDFWVSL